ncbi:hypothetical protein BKA65DRAFT_507541 [Rhexocercosporidium sp. MPI-PUGE-AT-0058]|nr:hypothetical protein BKA65DRAFT_507541 [Rhexocercosporidium sp. MPI-PUGE-AT-0058]
MPSSSIDQTPVPTFQQWVASRVRARDFAQAPVVGPNVLQPWTLEEDVQSYLSMLRDRSEPQATEFLDLWNRVRAAPTPPNTDAQERSWRDRREMYGLAPDLSPQMAIVQIVWGAEQTIERLAVLRRTPNEMDGVRPEDLTALADVNQAILQICWTCFTLDSPMTESSLIQVGELSNRRGEIQARIDPLIEQNRRADRARGEADHARRRDGARERAQVELHQREDGQVERREQRQSALEANLASIGAILAARPPAQDFSEDESVPILDYPGDVEALAEVLALSSEDDEDGRVRFRDDWLERDNILGDGRRPSGARRRIAKTFT